MPEPVYIVGAARTPIGGFLGTLSSLSYVDLGSLAVKAALKQVPIDPSQVDEIVFGNVYSANVGQAPARQVALMSGLSEKVVATTVNKVCASGSKAIIIGAQAILTGSADIVVAGGAESMSNVPHYLPSARTGTKFGGSSVRDGLEADGLLDAYSQQPMGVCAEDTAAKNHVSRQDSDDYAVSSYKRAQSAVAAKKFQNEICDVHVPGPRGKPATVVSADEEVVRLNEDKLRTARTVFQADKGTVTAPNASPLSDGGAALVLVSARKLRELKLTPLARILGWGEAARTPIEFPMAPADSVRVAVRHAGLSLSQVDYFELNEAFSTVGIVVPKLLDIDPARVNVYGGAVALGHPLGCSGARIVVTLISVLRQEGGKIGVSGICNGGGGASSLVIALGDN